MRARARYQLAAKLSLQASFSLLNNQNPTPGINYNFLSRQNSLSVSWTPSKRVSILGEYTRSTLYSNIGYLEPDRGQARRPIPLDRSKPKWLDLKADGGGGARFARPGQGSGAGAAAKLRAPGPSSSRGRP